MPAHGFFSDGIPAPSFFMEGITSLNASGKGITTPSYGTTDTVGYVEAVPPDGNASGGLIGDPADGIRLLQIPAQEAGFGGARRVSAGVWSDLYADGSRIPDRLLKGYHKTQLLFQLVTPTSSIRDMTGGTWAKVTMTAALTATGVDGAANSATRLTATGAGATILKTLTAAASNRIYSCYIRRVSGTGTVKLKQGATATSDLSSQLNTTTYTRCWLRASVLNVAFGIELGTSGDVIEVDFNQFEAASTKTYPGSPADISTRREDQLKYTGSGNMERTIGTVFAEYTQEDDNSSTILLRTAGAPQSVGLSSSTTGACQFTVISGGPPQCNIVVGSNTPGTRKKYAGYWKQNDFNGFQDGTPGTRDTSGNVPSSLGAQFGVGNNDNGPTGGDGFIRKFRLWTVVLSDAQIKAL